MVMVDDRPDWVLLALRRRLELGSVMHPEELAGYLGRAGVSAAELGRAVQPPVRRSHMSEMATGKRKIGPVMAHRLREAMARARSRSEETE